MPRGGGFYSSEQANHFRASNARVRIGGVDAAKCGARTRSGGACQLLPVKGSCRCLRHCGPKAAREFRERQKRDYALGRISHEAWERSEARRAANRLRDKWKKDPWAPGATISLGEHETTFLHDSGVGERAAYAPLAPAVLDWLRWRYRRLQIDRKRDDQWMRVLREELPARIEGAGSPTASDNIDLGQCVTGAVPWRGDALTPSPKRQLLDRPKAPARRADRSLRARGRCVPKPTANLQDLGAVYYRHREALAPLMAKCRDEQEQFELIRTLHDMDAAADTATASGVHTRWTGMVTELLAR